MHQKCQVKHPPPAHAKLAQRAKHQSRTKDVPRPIDFPMSYLNILLPSSIISRNEKNDNLSEIKKKYIAFCRVKHNGVQFHRVSDDIGGYREMWHPYGFVNPQRSVDLLN